MRLAAGILLGASFLAAGLASAVIGAETARAAWRQTVRHRAAALDPSALCEVAIRRAEARYGTPPALLRAISLVETGRPDHGAMRAWPWSVDVDGTPFYLPSRDAAVGFTRTVLLGGARSVDIGCMQVNLETHPDAFVTLEDGFDPRVNVDYATRFLLALHAGPAHLVWSTAVGFYHSQTEALASPYRARVIAINNTLLPAGVPSLDLSVPVHRAATPEDRMKKAWSATMTADESAADP